jgi:hypothetical protein
VISQLNEIMESTDFERLGDRSIGELRNLRDRLNGVEAGLSFGRRMAQGRLDIVQAEAEARRGGDPTVAAELLGSLPHVLAGNTRSATAPRPMREIELPDFASELVEATDAIVSPKELSDLGTLSDDELAQVAESLGDHERTVSLTRMNVHRIIDQVQEQIIGRYRDGAASVDDLLK